MMYLSRTREKLGMGRHTDGELGREASPKRDERERARLYRVDSSSTRQKFAMQLYSRLTNANPELVLVFMQVCAYYLDIGAKSLQPPFWCWGNVCAWIPIVSVLGLTCVG